MNNLHTSLSLRVLIGMIILSGHVNAQEIFGAGISFDPIPDTNFLYLTPGSTLNLNMSVDMGEGDDPAHSFSLSAPNQAYLTFSGFTSSLPAGWTSISTGNAFSAQNLTGADIQSGVDTVVGEVSYTVDPNAPIGTSLTLPMPSNVGILNDSGQQTVFINQIGWLYSPTVVAVPEPSSVDLACVGMFVLIIVTFLRRRSRSYIPY